MSKTPAPRLTGNDDLRWILGVAMFTAFVTMLMLSHLRVGFEAYRVARLRADENDRALRLDEEARTMSLELQHRVEVLDPRGIAAELDMQPPRAGQVVVIDAAASSATATPAPSSAEGTR